uniref:Uncharacterized protein n=1 Tax=viral metagenome TaxID=1070528 RepID=A0A6C0I634_9ZZZZ
MKPVFYASEIASLLGKNRFKSKNESLYRVLSKMPRFASAFASAADSLTERDILEIAPTSVKQDIEKAISETIVSTSQKEIKQTILEFQKRTAETLLNDAISGNAITAELQNVGERILKGETTVKQELEKLEVSPVVQTLTSQIQKQRGTRMESIAEDELGAKTGIAVSNRNTPVRYESLHYIIVGYIDGTSGDRIVETKNRKHFWGSPPEYDLIQLRCYMKMKGNVDGVLLERFPTGITRETLLHWDDSEWDILDSALRNLANGIEKMTLPEAERIVREILTKTDKKTR